MTHKRRVYYRPDGTVSIITPAPQSKRVDETEQEWLDRVYQRTDVHKEGLLFDDILDSDLPTDRLDREKWRGSKGMGITIDNTFITNAEHRNVLELELDKEISKPNGDPLTILKLQRRIEKQDYT